MDCRRSAHETLLVMATGSRIVEIGLDEAFLQQWCCAPRFPEGLDGIHLETGKLHHMILEPEPGLLFSLSVERLPLERPDGEWTHFMGDAASRSTATGAREFSLADLPAAMSYGRAILGQPGLAGTPRLDARKPCDHRPGRRRHPGFPAPLRDSPGRRTGLDIGRPQRLAGGQAAKLLKIEGDRPFYRQRDPNFAANGGLMLFDNGTVGATPPDPEQPVAGASRLPAPSTSGR